MFHLRPISSLALPELAPYRTMRRPPEHQGERIFVAEGDKVVRRLLESDFPVISALFLEKWVREFEALLRGRPENIPVFVTSKECLDQIVGFEMYQGALAVGQFPAPIPLETLIARGPHPRLLVALEELNNADNLGVVVRNCAAFGVQALILGETSSTPYMRRTVRHSMGTIFKQPIVESTHLVQTLQHLRQRGIQCVAAHGPAHPKTLAHCDLRSDVCLVFGNEGLGLSAEVLAACDEQVSIPMANAVDSINLANAVAVFLYETDRQRGLM